MEDLKLIKKISKMNDKELKQFLDKECKTKEDREYFLNNPYFELYDDSKDLSKIVLEDALSIDLDFESLNLDDSFINSKYFTVIRNTETFNRLYHYTTKQIIYFRINEYLKENPTTEDFIQNNYTRTDTKKELQDLAKLKKNLLNYINKQQTIYNDRKKIKQNFIMEEHLRGFYSVNLSNNQINLYKNILQDIRDTKRKLIKHLKTKNYKLATQKYKLFKDLKSFVELNYKYQREVLRKKIRTLEIEIRNYNKFKNGLSEKKTLLKNLQSKLKDIPKDVSLKIEYFLNSEDLNLNINSKNQHKYKAQGMFLYKIKEN